MDELVGKANSRPSCFSTLTMLIACLTPVLCEFQGRAALAGANPTDALAMLTGVDAAGCAASIADLTGSQSDGLLDGLSEGEAAELLELIADLSGLPESTSTSTATVGIVGRPEFRRMA